MAGGQKRFSTFAPQKKRRNSLTPQIPAKVHKSQFPRLTFRRTITYGEYLKASAENDRLVRENSELKREISQILDKKYQEEKVDMRMIHTEPDTIPKLDDITCQLEKITSDSETMCAQLTDWIHQVESSCLTVHEVAFIESNDACGVILEEFSPESKQVELMKVDPIHQGKENQIDVHPDLPRVADCSIYDFDE